MRNFQRLEVVDRGSETQPKVVENLIKSTNQDKGYVTKVDYNKLSHLSLNSRTLDPLCSTGV